MQGSSRALCECSCSGTRSFCASARGSPAHRASRTAPPMQRCMMLELAMNVCIHSSLHAAGSDKGDTLIRAVQVAAVLGSRYAAANETAAEGLPFVVTDDVLQGHGATRGDHLQLRMRCIRAGRGMQTLGRVRPVGWIRRQQPLPQGCPPSCLPCSWPSCSCSSCPRAQVGPGDRNSRR